MTRKSVCTLTLVLLNVAANGALHGQDSAKVVILSPRVGPVIDKAEREYYHVFSPYARFEQAVILQTPDKRYFARITRLASPSGVESDTLVEYSEPGLIRMAERIDHLEELSSGDYVIGQEPVTLQFAEGGAVSLQAVPKAKRAQATVEVGPKFEKLPIDMADEGFEYETFPLFGIGIGVSTYSPDLGGLENAFKGIEEYYRDQGHPVSTSNRSLTASPLLCAFLDTRFSSRLTVSLEAGFSTGAVKMQTFSVSSTYAIATVADGHLRPYAGAGISRYSFRVERGYGAYVSPATTLDAITVQGGKTGANVRLGTEYVPVHAAHIQLFATYVLFPKLDATTSEMEAVKVNLSSFQIGSRIILYF